MGVKIPSTIWTWLLLGTSWSIQHTYLFVSLNSHHELIYMIVCCLSGSAEKDGKKQIVLCSLFLQYLLVVYVRFWYKYEFFLWKVDSVYVDMGVFIHRDSTVLRHLIFSCSTAADSSIQATNCSCESSRWMRDGSHSIRNPKSRRRIGRNGRWIGKLRLARHHSWPFDASPA